MEELVAYWRSGFDWRAQEASLNRFRQFTVPLGGIELHFIHEPGRGPQPIPLLLSHGWPGSIVEFRRLIPLLTERFTVVAPSLPGYTLSFRPGQKRFAVEEIADLFAELMSDVLGYRRFAAQGGDWGAFVSSVLGWRHPEKLIGIHLNLLAIRRDPKIPSESGVEAAYLAQLAQWLKEETGYQWIQGTRPQTLAYALTDSPAGLAAWIAEKFWKWSDCGGVIENAVSRDDLLANVALYWFTGAIGSSFWPYYARMHGPWPIPDGKTVDVPTQSFRRRSCDRRGPSRRAPTPTSGAGLRCRAAAISRRSSSPSCSQAKSWSFSPRYASVFWFAGANTATRRAAGVDP
jgi:microsomal epoxide hydrolase